MQHSLAFMVLAGLAAAQGPIKATFTQYGSNDTWGSGNCQSNTVACGFYTTGEHAYYAAISQNYYGAGPGAGAGPDCGKCWLLTPETDASGNALKGANPIVVKVNNLCPAQGNPLCAQQGTSGTNQYGANLNVDTCQDSGASQALFGASGTGMAIGTAEMVDCSQWNQGGGAPTSLVSPAVPVSSSPPSSSSPSAAAAPGSSSSSSSTSSSGSVAALYGQCGGQNWSGPTSCASGSTCKVQNPYYSQCLPGSKKMKRSRN